MEQRDMKDVRPLKESIDHALEVVDYSMFPVTRRHAEGFIRLLAGTLLLAVAVGAACYGGLYWQRVASPLPMTIIIAIIIYVHVWMACVIVQPLFAVGGKMRRRVERIVSWL